MDWKAGVETRSPLTARFHDGDRSTVVMIFYDETTRLLDRTGRVTRDHGCTWSTFVVGGMPVVLAEEGVDLSFDTSMLGVHTIDELNAAGFTAGR